MEALTLKREAEAAVAEAEVLEAIEAKGDYQVLDAVSEEEKMERTSLPSHNLTFTQIKVGHLHRSSLLHKSVTTAAIQHIRPR